MYISSVCKRNKAIKYKKSLSIYNIIFVICIVLFVNKCCVKILEYRFAITTNKYLYIPILSNLLNVQICYHHNFAKFFISIIHKSTIFVNIRLVIFENKIEKRQIVAIL